MAENNADTNNKEKPSDANENCVGPTSDQAGKSSACEGCPNQAQCASGQFSNPKAQQIKNDEHTQIKNALSNVSNILLVLSGKGGVGKSTVCCQLAHSLASRGYNVGVLDVDICGPSVARMMGVSGQTVHKSGSGWCPVYKDRPNLGVMSVSFLLKNEDTAMVWRGPKKDGMIKQFFMEVNWAEDGAVLDYLLIDTPPGTSDEHISTVQYIQGALAAASQNTNSDMQDREDEITKLGGAIVVTTPEEVAMADVRKELQFCVKAKLPVLGLVENMSMFQTRIQDLSFQRLTSTDNDAAAGGGKYEDCTKEILNTLAQKCPEIFNDTNLFATSKVFPPSGSGPRGMAKRFNIPYFGALPLDPNLLKSCEEGICFTESFPESVGVEFFEDIVDKVIEALPPLDEEGDEKMGM